MNKKQEYSKSRKQFRVFNRKRKLQGKYPLSYRDFLTLQGYK